MACKDNVCFYFFVTMIALAATLVSSLPTNQDLHPSPPSPASEETLLVSFQETAAGPNDVAEEDLVLDDLFIALNELNGIEDNDTEGESTQEEEKPEIRNSNNEIGEAGKSKQASVANSGDEDAVEPEVDVSEEDMSADFDYEVLTIVAIIAGTVSASLLVILAICVFARWYCGCGRKDYKKKNLSLNSDLNRWDPQLLRPTQKNIDAFIYGTPIPSVSEMIKKDSLETS